MALGLIVMRTRVAKSLEGLAGCVLKTNKWTELERKLRIERFGHVVFKLLYFIATSAMGWFILKEKDWMPTNFGGSGLTANLWKGWPLEQKLTTDLKVYYIVALAYHLHSLIYTLMAERRNDFIEMITHHFATIFLIFFSYVGNLARIGALVIYLHDIGDVTAYLVKSFVDTKYTVLTLSAYALLLSSWGYLRLYCFPFVVIYSSLHESPILANQSIPGKRVFDGLLSSLLLLHLYWYTLFLKIGWTFAISGVAEDTVNNMKLDARMNSEKLQSLNDSIPEE